MNEEETVVVSVSRFNQLVRDSRFLTALKVAGVENWYGYEIALEVFNDTDYD